MSFSDRLWGEQEAVLINEGVVEAIHLPVHCCCCRWQPLVRKAIINLSVFFTSGASAFLFLCSPRSGCRASLYWSSSLNLMAQSSSIYPPKSDALTSRGGGPYHWAYRGGGAYCNQECFGRWQSTNVLLKMLVTGEPCSVSTSYLSYYLVTLCVRLE